MWIPDIIHVDEILKPPLINEIYKDVYNLWPPNILLFCSISDKGRRGLYRAYYCENIIVIVFLPLLLICDIGQQLPHIPYGEVSRATNTFHNFRRPFLGGCALHDL